MMKKVLQSVIILFNLELIFGGNILIFLPSPFKSHVTAYKPLFKELAMRGHNVTFYTALPFQENIPNIKQVVIRDFLTAYAEEILLKNKDCMKGWRHILSIWEIGIFSAEKFYQEQLIQELIQSTDLSFDLILLETFFAHESFAFLGHKFNAPVINVHPFMAEEWISDILRNPQPLSYVPNFRLPITDHMNFYERVQNSIYYMIRTLTGHYYYLPAQERIMRKYVNYPGSQNLPPLIELLKNTALTLVDGNSLVLFQSPNIPDIIPVGGLNIIEDKKLPKNIEKFINESVNGIIYFSLGSYLQVSKLPSEKLKIITKVLGNLPQRVLLKWENDEKLPGEPKNVLTSKWFAQLGILAHPKCRAFVTHGGIHSLMEAAYFGVPIVGIPLQIDQENNLLLTVQKGFSQLLKLEDLTEDIFSSALDKILKDPSYKKNAEILSRLVKDVPMTPMETAVFWIEHVLRHKGAPHLQVAGRHLPWYQYYLLDVIFAFLTAIILIVFLLYNLSKKILKLIFRSKNKLGKADKSRKSKKE